MLVHPNPDPVAFSIGPVDIHWYGLMYVVAFGLFFLAVGDSLPVGFVQALTAIGYRPVPLRVTAAYAPSQHPEQHPQKQGETA